MQNNTLFQFFHWYYPGEHLWNDAAAEAGRLSELGITALWLPPACKGSSGKNSFGYDVYDLYDLGEFDQKGSVATKFGTRDEYLRAIEAIHAKNMQVYADVVLNHKAGADETEDVLVHKVNPENRGEVISGDYHIKAYTKFTFPGRGDKYSAFKWDYHCFGGVDRDENKQESGIYKILNEYGTDWQELLGKEKGNFDYLMLSDIEFRNPAVREELIRWGKWYLEMTGVDGFRLDAVKHIPFSFFREWLGALRSGREKEVFAVGEYWKTDDVNILLRYIEVTEGCMTLFDAPLHDHFHVASRKGKDYDLRKILDDTLVKKNPLFSVTLVDNHDTQPLREFDSSVNGWFRPLAYALILLRQEGYPCVFYPDLYGADYHDKGKEGKEVHVKLEPCQQLEKLLLGRKQYAYGLQRDYFDHPNVIGWTREGTDENPSSGCAVLLSNGDEGQKEMETGGRHAGKTFMELTGSRQDKVVIREDGKAVFPVNAGSVAVWVPEG